MSKSALRRLVEPLEARYAPATLVGLTDANQLITFDSSTPETVSAPISITGLAANFVVQNLDVRPSTGLLYALASDADSSALYVINPTNGAATFIADLDHFVAGEAGIDFDPVSDRLFVVNTAGEFGSVNVDNGDYTALPSVGAVAAGSVDLGFHRNLPGLGTSTAFLVSSANDQVFTLNTSTGGTSVYGPGIAGDPTRSAFDIITSYGPDGTLLENGYALLQVSGVTGLYSVDVTTGAVSGVGTFGTGTTAIKGMAALLPAPPTTAYTVTANNQLLLFSSVNAGGAGSQTFPLAIPAGETVLGLDFRPTDGALILLTKDTANAGRLYTVNTTDDIGALSTGTLLSAAGSSSYSSLEGVRFGLDFNPVTDQLRIVSDAGQNLRVSTATGLVTEDVDLSLNSSLFLGASGAAYTNAFLGTQSTVLFDLNAATDKLYRQLTPNDGTVQEVGSFGVDATAINGFDIRDNGQAFATMTVNGSVGFYEINLATGAATFIAPVGATLQPLATSGLALKPTGSLGFNVAPVQVAEGATSAMVTINRLGGSSGAVTAQLNFAGTATAGADYTLPEDRVITFADGQTSVTIEIPLLNDNLVEGSETILVSVAGLGGLAKTNGTTGTVQILDDEPALPPTNVLGLTSGNALVSFAAGTPGTILSTTAVTGLGSGETLVGIDFRPATGQLYGLTKDGSQNGRIYIIDAATGAATLMSQLNVALNGTTFDIDFNPMADRLRIVSDTEQSLRVVVETGEVTTQTSLDTAGAGYGAAYTENYAGSGATDLYVIDSVTDSLYRIETGTGESVLIGSLGLDAVGIVGFDIYSKRAADGSTTANSAVVTMTVNGVTGLYLVDLTTGSAASVGTIGTGNTALVSAAVPTGTPAATAYTVDENNHLLSFKTDTPSNATDLGVVTGLGTDEIIVGFDLRPSNGTIYVLAKNTITNAGKIYTLNTTNAALTNGTTLIAAGGAYTSLNGVNFGVDFNPFNDTLRVVTDNGQNLQVNVATGAVTVNTLLTTGSGTALGVTAAAYLNNFAGAGSTSLYDINTDSDQLFIQTNQAAGTLQAVGLLGVGDVTAATGFDIRSADEAYATLTVGGVAGLYSINLTTGKGTFIGQVGDAITTKGLVLASSGSLQLSPTTVTIAEGATATVTVSRVGGADTAVTFQLTLGGTATAGSDYTAITRWVTLPAGQATATFDLVTIDDAVAESSETITVTLGNVSTPSRLGTPNVSTVTITDNEPLLTATGVTKVEGNSGSTTFSFLVSLSGPSVATVTVNFGTATPANGALASPGVDYQPTSGTLTFAPGETSKMVDVTVFGDTVAEPNEIFDVNLSGISTSATLVTTSVRGTIVNDDVIGVNPRSITYTDAQGDLVTITTTRGSFSSDNLLVEAVGTLGGVQLVELDLTAGAGDFSKASITMTAKRTVTGGDGLVNLGYLNATGVELTSFSITGDLGKVEATSIGALTMGSLGKLGINTQAGGLQGAGDLASTIQGNLGKLTVKTDVVNASLFVGGSLTTLSVGGSIRGGAEADSGSIEVGARLGTVSVLGSLIGGTGTDSGRLQAKTGGVWKIRELDNASILLAGNASPVRAAEAVALGSLITYGMEDSEVLIGYNGDRQLVNGDVTTGAIRVAGDWTRSNLLVGVDAAGDGLAGNVDVVGPQGAAPSIVARIASITITGQVIGSDTPSLMTNLAAEQIGSLIVSGQRLRMVSTAVDSYLYGVNENVRVREITQQPV